MTLNDKIIEKIIDNVDVESEKQKYTSKKYKDDETYSEIMEDMKQEQKNQEWKIEYDRNYRKEAFQYNFSSKFFSDEKKSFYENKKDEIEEELKHQGIKNSKRLAKKLFFEYLLECAMEINKAK